MSDEGKLEQDLRLTEYSRTLFKEPMTLTQPPSKSHFIIENLFHHTSLHPNTTFALIRCPTDHPPQKQDKCLPFQKQPSIKSQYNTPTN
jgi:hypothetical protein